MKKLVIIAQETIPEGQEPHSLKLVTTRWLTDSVGPHPITGHYEDGYVVYRLKGGMTDEGLGVTLRSPDHAGTIGIAFSRVDRPEVGDGLYFTDVYGEEWEYVVTSVAETTQEIE